MIPLRARSGRRYRCLTPSVHMAVLLSPWHAALQFDMAGHTPLQVSVPPRHFRSVLRACARRPHSLSCSRTRHQPRACCAHRARMSSVLGATTSFAVLTLTTQPRDAPGTSLRTACSSTALSVDACVLSAPSLGAARRPGRNSGTLQHIACTAAAALQVCMPVTLDLPAGAVMPLLDVRPAHEGPRRP
jgi:hypothetical protein